MCGISGIIKKGASPHELEGIVSRMNNTQRRRGPDDHGVFVDDKNGLALGHTRLSILDLSPAGHQPMSMDKLQITFNGEIYNFLELRDELKKKGHEFKTNSDTEVILAAYAEWATASFSKLRGMFAFGLWDNGKQKLFLVKDRYGIKPLYYYSNQEKLVFASTVKAIKASGLAPDKKNEKAAIGFLLFGSVPLSHTTQQDVHGLEAGCYLEINNDLSVKKVKYYDPLNYFNKTIEQENKGTREQVVKKVRELLEDSVSKHLISDAPLGVFLSGGIDSSVLAILAAKQRDLSNPGVKGTPTPGLGRNPRLTTLSIVFDEQAFSEQKYQQLIAKQIGSDHHEYKVTKQDFENALPDIWDAMDQPTVDGINTYFVAQAAKKAGLKTVLSGLGADEIFMGYPSFRRASLFRRLQQLPGVLKAPVALGLNLGQLLGDRWSKLGYLRHDDVLRFYLAIRGLFAPPEVAKILGISVKEVNDFIDDLAKSYQLSAISLANLHPANLLSYFELKFYLQNQLLKDSDFMAMHHSVEIRVPFLDHPLVEYLSSLSAQVKLAGSQPKQLLVGAVPELPRDIWDRPKMGFTFPFQKWLSALPLQATSYKLKAKKHWSRTWALSILHKFS